MNERMQELAEQADKFAKENRTQTISGPGNNYFELFHEKFAQLIIKEVHYVIFVGGVENLDIVLEHFGVEE
jgi:hypothetical protein